MRSNRASIGEGPGYRGSGLSRPGTILGRERELQVLFDTLRDNARHGAVVVGAPGVGRSALLASWVEELRELGRAPLVAAGSASASEIPLGALAHLLPETPAASPGEMLRTAHRAIGASSEQEQPIVVIDDAQILDGVSATFLHQLVVSGAAFVVLGISTGTGLPAAIAEVRDHGRVDAVVLEPLHESDTARVAHTVLGGAVSYLATVELSRLSGGYPKYLHGLIRDARANGNLVTVDGVWHLKGHLSPGPTVERSFEDALKPLSQTDRELLELVAMASSVPFAFLEKRGARASLEHLEAAGLIMVDADCAMSTTRPASPLLAQVVRGQLTTARFRYLDRVIEEQLGDPEGTDSNSPAPELMFNGGPGTSDDSLIRAVREAIEVNDHARARRYARAGINAGNEVAGRLSLAEALLSRGEAAGAAAVLGDAQRVARDDESVARVALARIRLLRDHALEPDHAVMVGREALDQLTSEDWRDEIFAELAMQAGLAGDYREALELGTRVTTRPGASDRALVGSLHVSAQGQVMLGHLDDALSSVERALALVGPVTAELPEIEDLLVSTRFQVELFQGRLDVARATCEARYDEAAKRRNPSLVGLWEASLATAEMLRGNLDRATDLFCRATGQLEVADARNRLPTVKCWRALAEVQSGAVRVANLLLESVGASNAEEDFRVNGLKKRVQGWARAQIGDHGGGARLAFEAGRLLAERSHVVWGCLSLHDAVRFGEAALVADELGDMAAGVDSPLVAAMADHARALRARAAEDLDRVSLRFAAMGAAVLAAEVATQAAELHAAAGHRTAAGRSSARASTFASLSSGASSPVLRDRVPFLTRREEEIARLAAEGFSSRDIGLALVISPRTVDNHLSTVYAKLGVHGRTELAELLNQGNPISA